MISIALVVLMGAGLSTPAAGHARTSSLEPAITPQPIVRQSVATGADPQAILEAVDVCHAWMTTAEDMELDALTPYQRAVHDAVAAISTLFVDAKTHEVETRAASRALNGAPNVWLSEGHAGCSLTAAELDGRDRPTLDTLRPGVLALLSAEGSGWTSESDARWVRYDGWTLSFGNDTDGQQRWAIERTN